MFKGIGYALILVSTLAAQGARATPCANANPPPLNCINAFSLKGQGDDTFLVSDVRTAFFTLFTMTIRYGMLLPPTYDGLINVVWRDKHGDTLVSGGDGYLMNPTYWAAWGAEWEGALVASQPSVMLETGEADFTNTTLFHYPCLAEKCPANYHVWIGNAGTGGTAPLRAAQSAASALPAGFEWVTETRANVSDMIRTPTDPANLDTATEILRYRFSSRYEAISGGYRYLYSVENLTDAPVDFDLSELGFTGSLDGSQTQTLEVLSPNGPSFTRTTPKIITAGGGYIAGRFDALTPVPEPATAALMLAGVGLLGLRLARAGRLRLPRAAGPAPR